MTPTEIALLVSLIAILTFAWSVFGVFRSGEDTTHGYTIVKVSSMASWLFQLYLVGNSNMAFGSIGYWIGNLLVLTGISLFWCCVNITKSRKLTLVFSTDTPEHIYLVGPYGYVRHPFYLSYLAAYLGMAISSNNIWLYLTAGLMAFVYHHAARFEESKFESSQLAEEYAAYKLNTGMFLPRAGRFFRFL